MSGWLMVSGNHRQARVMIAVDIVAEYYQFQPTRLHYLLRHADAEAATLPQLTEQAPQTILSSSLRMACCTAAVAVRIPNGRYASGSQRQ